ncbi:centrosomal protein of 290 kDa-like [Lycorma delicatula]|uniref:centrosomal protein of 290 kDa-like n=1 Tax=Lycorma delicatula TaxID=130591 RepID=UPI003F51A153
MERLIPVSWTHEEHGLQAWTALSYLLYVNNNLSRAAYLAQKRHLKEDTRKPSAISILQHQLQEAQGKIALLEAKVRDAEEDAQSKAEEMSNMIIQLREYETGEFGLSQAMEQIKELRKQKAVCDKHIEQLVQAGNQLQEEANQLEEENLILRLGKLASDNEILDRKVKSVLDMEVDQRNIE